MTKRREKLAEIFAEFKLTYIKPSTGKIMYNEKPRTQVYGNPIENLELKLHCWKHGYSLSEFLMTTALTEVRRLRSKNKNTPLENEMQDVYKKHLQYKKKYRRKVELEAKTQPFKPFDKKDFKEVDRCKNKRCIEFKNKTCKRATSLAKTTITDRTNITMCELHLVQAPMFKGDICVQK